NPVPLTIPMGTGHEFAGIIDLLSQEALYYDKETFGREVRREPIPAEYVEIAQEWRSKLMDAVADLDEQIMLAYLEGDEVPLELIHAALRKGTLAQKFQVTYAGSSLDYCGVQPILDGVVNYLPSPLDVPPVHGEHPNPGKKDTLEQERKTDPDEPFAGLIFKIVADKHADLCFVRVYSGTLKSGSRVLNARTGKKELISQLWHIQADAREKLETDSVEAGDIVGVIGPKDVVTGDTICDQKAPILLESITFPETVISMAIEPDSSADRKKLEDALALMGKQDPTFKAKINEETGQTIISGMGELHLEIITNRLKDKDHYGLNVKVHKPRVSYRETVKSTVSAEEEFSRSTQGETHYARIKVQIEPSPNTETIEVLSKLKPGEIPAEADKIVRQAVLESAQSGGIVGYPLMHVRFTILDVGYREGETDEEALRAAAAHAVQAALTKAQIGLLEPVMKLEVVTPSEFLGNIQGDLNQRHAHILGSEPRGHLIALEAQVPLARMFGYSSHVRSLSQGRASFSMEPLKYDLAPQSVLDEMLN
ncbi:MAG: elongation factor G, partial [Planctomycetaceae bacterium]|nr:elongation factor G [Planctomycetaceae bacterium]